MPSLCLSAGVGHTSTFPSEGGPSAFHSSGSDPQTDSVLQTLCVQVYELAFQASSAPAVARPTRRSYRCGLANPPMKHRPAIRSNYSNLPRSPFPAAMKRAGGVLAHWSDETFNITDFNMGCSDLKSHPLPQLQWKVQQLTCVCRPEPPLIKKLV